MYRTPLILSPVKADTRSISQSNVLQYDHCYEGNGMAQIVLSGDEIISILYANELVPRQVTEMKAEGDEIRLKVRTQWPLLRSVRVGVRFSGYEGGQAVLQLITNRLIDKFDWLVDKMLESLHLADYGGRWEYPCLYVDINRFVEQRIRGISIDGMVFQEGRFHITTSHPEPIPDMEDAFTDTDGDGSYLSL